MTNTKSPELPKAVGVRIDDGPWMDQFAVTGAVECTAEDCPGWSHTFTPGEHMRAARFAIQGHMLDAHLNLTAEDFTFDREAAA